MKKTLTIYAALCCLAALLCSCAKQTSAPMESLSPSESRETANSSSAMQQMQLSEMEQFCLSAFSSNCQNAVYEIQLAEKDTYTKFIAAVYKYRDGKWVKDTGLKADIEGPVSYFAVDYSGLPLSKMAFKSSSTCRSNDIISSDEKSLFTGGYGCDTDMNKSITITDQEMPLIAIRRSGINSEEKKANLKDFYSPEAIPTDEIEEYYLLTIRFVK